MPDRGRDLEFSILTKVDQFDTEGPARKLDDLATSADQATRQIDEMDQQARDTARNVDSALDRIATSARTNLRTRVDGDVEHTKRKFSEVKEEAHQTARESFASFSGAGSFTDAAQEIAANAGAIFGPIGLGIGSLLSAGIFKFTSDWQAAKERIQQLASDLTQALIESKGRIDEAFITSKITEFAKDNSILEIRDQALKAGVSVNDFVRALAGDEAALGRVRAQLDANSVAMDAHKGMTGRLSQAENNQAAAIEVVRGRLGEQATAYGIAKQAANAAREAAEKPTRPVFDGAKAANDADNYRARLDAAASRPVVFTASLDTSAAYQSFRQMERDFANSQTRVRP